MRTDRGTRRSVELVAHLTAREFRIRYEAALLGWLWAIAPPFVRLAVLAFVFTRVVPVDGPDYVATLAVGLLGWTWFAAGVSSATRSSVDRRELVAQPGLPRGAVPAVSVLTDALDYLAALPVLLLVVVVSTGGLPATALLLPVALLLQGCLVLGLGMAAAVLDVRFRDSRLGVDLLLGVGFYATPVFYRLDTVSGPAASFVALNPVAQLLEAQRALLVDGRLPELLPFLATAAVCVAVLAAGWAAYAWRAPTMLDDL